MTNTQKTNQPTMAYIGATWGSLIIGIASYMLGLWNATLQLNEKGFYLAVFLLAMFSAVALQKTVRDKEEGLPVTKIFIGLCWSAFFASIALLIIGLINAQMFLSEKGFYGISFVLSLFSVITVQKNIRDMTDEKGITDPAAFPTTKKEVDFSTDSAELENH
ncbi:MAG: hypothetical protein GY710_01290 [Desulfobacteraceae bacterium]|nr:hypothetical protein [Desulfobacteraceae bacterium]